MLEKEKDSLDIFQLQRDIRLFQQRGLIINTVKDPLLHSTVYGVIEKIWDKFEKSVTRVKKSHLKFRQNNPKAYFRGLIAKQMKVYEDACCLQRVIARTLMQIDVRGKQNIFEFCKFFYIKNVLKPHFTSDLQLSKLKRFCQKKGINYKESRKLIALHKEYPVMLNFPYGSEQCRSFLFMVDYFSKASQRLQKIKQVIKKNQKKFMRIASKQENIKSRLRKPIKSLIKIKKIRKNPQYRHQVYLIRKMWAKTDTDYFKNIQNVDTVVKHHCSICWKLSVSCICCKKCKQYKCICYEQQYIQLETGQAIKVLPFKKCPWKNLIRRSTSSKRRRFLKRQKLARMINKNVKGRKITLYQQLNIRDSKLAQAKLAKLAKPAKKKSPAKKIEKNQELSVIQEVVQIDLISESQPVQPQNRPEPAMMSNQAKFFQDPDLVRPIQQEVMNFDDLLSESLLVQPHQNSSLQQSTKKCQIIVIPKIFYDPVLVRMPREQFYFERQAIQMPLNSPRSMAQQQPQHEVQLQIQKPLSWQHMMVQCYKGKNLLFTKSGKNPIISKPQQKSQQNQDVVELSFQSYCQIQQEKSQSFDPNTQKYVIVIESQSQISLVQAQQVNDSDQLIMNMSLSVQQLDPFYEEVKNKMQNSDSEAYLYDPEDNQGVNCDEQVLLFNLGDIFKQMQENQKVIDEMIQSHQSKMKIPTRKEMPIISRVTSLFSSIQKQKKSSDSQEEVIQIPDPTPLMTRNQKKNMKKQRQKRRK